MQKNYFKISLDDVKVIIMNENNLRNKKITFERFLKLLYKKKIDENLGKVLKKCQK